MSDKRFFALDQNGDKLFVGDTVFRKVKSKPNVYSDIMYPPDNKFYVITQIEPDYESKDAPGGGECFYISIDGPEGTYAKASRWRSVDFIFSCRPDISW